ncbi:suppressor of fused domain protein [Methylobacterium sp. J-090]|uniref:suppressor of fused domain protein n=1 Tax=Methylobacterium sp. J-090 TaxID=2836666 RepID=UPI001FBA389E|nr:suppressor of fused domain protein [Methylobacterium sp. J-090]MCJ2082383.1 suppressor of fused domain protein [Methylobacterium sp. J-090]
MSEDITDDNRAVARTLARTFGGAPVIRRHRDETGRSHVDLLTCRDAPAAGVTSYATVTLANHPIILDGAEFPARAELVGACASETERFAHVLAACAFHVIDSGWFLAPGIVFPGVVAASGLSRTLAHVMFVLPALWPTPIDTMEFGPRSVAFLMAVPISAGEYAFAQDKGGDALEELLAAHRSDPFDIHRPSVV